MGALIATLQCRFDEARELLRVAEEATRRPRDQPERAAIALPRLVLLVADGMIPDALDEIRRARSSLGTWPADPIVLDTLRAWEARLLAATGDTAAAEQVLTPEPRGPLTGSALARLRLDQGDVSRALAAITAAGETTMIVFASVAADIELVHGLVCRAARQRAEAAEHLERALDVAAPAGFLRPLLSHGPLLSAALQDHLRRGTNHGAFVTRALALMQPRATSSTAVAGFEPLSPRERQVLGYLPSTLSNEEIARDLFVSVNTVKTHLRSIYRKLGVAGRQPAVTRANELGLLTSASLVNVDLSPRSR